MSQYTEEVLPYAVRLRLWGGPQGPPNARQMAILRATLDVIPLEHLCLLRLIEARRAGQAPAHGGGHDPAGGVIRLSAESFGKPYNQTLNQTLLHEMGHIVDAGLGGGHYVCTQQIQQMRAQGDADAAALLNTLHRGATPGAIERTADAYLAFVMLRIARAPFVHGAQPGAYVGSEAERRFRVLLETRAGAGLRRRLGLTDDFAATIRDLAHRP